MYGRRTMSWFRHTISPAGMANPNSNLRISVNKRHFILMRREANEGDHGGLDELYERKLIPNACTRATEESHQVAPYARVV